MWRPIAIYLTKFSKHPRWTRLSSCLWNHTWLRTFLKYLQKSLTRLSKKSVKSPTSKQSKSSNFGRRTSRKTRSLQTYTTKWLNYSFKLARMKKGKRKDQKNVGLSRLQITSNRLHRWRKEEAFQRAKAQSFVGICLGRDLRLCLIMGM